MKKETNQMVNRYSDELKRRFGNFTYIENQSNLGLAESYNKGFRQAAGKILFFCNDDIYLPIGSLDSLSEVIRKDNSIGSVGPLTNFAYSLQNITLFPRLKNYSDDEKEKIEKFYVWLKQNMQGRQYESHLRLQGFCLAIDGELLKKLGYLDAKYRHALFEDTDLDRKIKESGKRAVIDASTFVEHGGIDGGSKSIMQKPLKTSVAYLINGARFAIKWHDLPYVIYDATEGTRCLAGKGHITKDIEVAAKANGTWDELEKIVGKTTK